ncbi:MAG: hypothetical protein L6V78_01660 [Clostridium sp.]|nr:MAG: hypothetical protein L6V78_01660 [Clostridium sp.]
MLFAIYLLCEIFLILANIIGLIGDGFKYNGKNVETPKSEAYLVVDLATSNLIIKEGDTFDYIINNKEITAEKKTIIKIIIKEKKDTLEVKKVK